MKILILTSRFPYPLEKGDKLRIYHQIQNLATRAKLYLIALSDHPIAQPDQAQLQAFCREVHVLSLHPVSYPHRLRMALQEKWPYQVAYFYQKSTHQRFRSIIEQVRPDLVYGQLVRVAPYLLDYEGPRVLDFMDAFSAQMRRRSDQSPIWLQPLVRSEQVRLAHFEARVLDAIGAGTVISDRDREELAVSDKDRIYVIPNGVDTAYFHPRAKTGQYELVFVGNMGYHPNVEAAKYLVAEIMPRLWEIDNRTRLLIAGARPATEVKKLAGDRVTVSGWVPDIRDAYADGKVFVAPLFLGSGQQNKILEAMAMGVPCVTTPLVNQAIGAAAGESILLAGDAAAFAAQVRRLLREETHRQQVATKGLEFVRKKMSWASAGDQLWQLLQKVQQGVK